MKVYNPQTDRHLSATLKLWLEHYRFIRQFDPQQYSVEKARILNHYMKSCGLKACVVAVSGGIDSAAVLALVRFAKEQPDSPIEKIVPVLLPVFDSPGATGQEQATQRGTDVCSSQGLDPVIINLAACHESLNSHISTHLDIQGENWALGQLVAHTRTPSLYYTATLLTQNGQPAIICGTTNRDEGLYLGYFGKASDGLVDVQMISDLHKSEVYAVARHLNVAQSALEVAPKGDMYDGREDEEVFGAPYDFVELYMYYKSLPEAFAQSLYTQLDNQAREQFDFFAGNLENMHRYNRHKYFGASPAVHFDVDNLVVPEGWKTNCNFSSLPMPAIDKTKFVGYFKEDALPASFFMMPDVNANTHINTNANTDITENCHRSAVTTYRKEEQKLACDIIVIDDFLSQDECAWMLEQLADKASWVGVNKYGNTHFTQDAQDTENLRASMYNADLAQSFFQRLAGHIPMIQNNEKSRILQPHEYWRATGVNPLMRFIRYQGEHFLVPHYDDTFIFNRHQKTLMSLIIYLEDSEAQTRFIKDSQLDLPEAQRNYRDWEHLADDKDSILAIQAKKGRAVLFNHRVLHDATSPALLQKTIIRSDVIFNAPYHGIEL